MQKKKGKYVHKSPAVNFTVYDLSGDSLSDTLVRELESLVTERVKSDTNAQLAINVSRT